MSDLLSQFDDMFGSEQATPPADDPLKKFDAMFGDEGVSPPPAVDKASLDQFDKLAGNKANQSPAYRLADKFTDGAYNSMYADAAVGGVPADQRDEFLSAIHELASQKKAGSKKNLAAKAVIGEFNSVYGLAGSALRMVGLDGMDEDQRRFARQLRSVWENADSIHNPDAPWYSPTEAVISASEAAPAIMAAGGVGNLAGSAAKAVGVGVKGAGAAAEVGAAASFAPEMYQNTYDTLLDKGVAPGTAKWAAMTSASINSALMGALSLKVLPPSLGGQDFAKQTASKLALKYAASVGIHGPTVMASSQAVDEVAQDLAQGQPKDVQEYINNWAKNYRKSIPTMALIAAPGAISSIGAPGKQVSVESVKQERRNAEILAMAKSGETPSREKFKDLGLPKTSGKKFNEEYRRDELRKAADVLLRQRTPQDPNTAPAAEMPENVAPQVAPQVDPALMDNPTKAEIDTAVEAAKQPEAAPQRVSIAGDNGELISTPDGRIDVQHTFGANPPPRGQTVIDFVVEEAKRGQGVGDKLLKQAMEKYPDLGGQVSSPASLKVFYNNGFRNPDMPEASFADHLKAMPSGESLYMARNNESGKPYVSSEAAKPSVEPSAPVAIEKPIGDEYVMNGTKVKFTDGEHKGMTGTVYGVHKFETKGQARVEKNNPTYKIQIDGFGKAGGKPGGWNGDITQTHDTLKKLAVRYKETAPEVVAHEVTPEVASKPPETTSIKNAATKEGRVERGQEAIEGKPEEKVEDWFASAEVDMKADPDLAARTIKEVIENPRTLSDKETAMLQLRKRQLNNTFTAASDKLFEANKSGNKEATEKAQADANAILKNLDDLDTASKYAGSEWGKSGVARQQELRADFSLATLVRRARVAKGGAELDMSKGGEYDKIKEQAEQIADLQKQLDKYVETGEAPAKKGFVKKTVKRERTKKALDEAWADFKSKISGGPTEGIVKGESGALNLDLVESGLKLAKAATKHGISTVSEFLENAKGVLGEKFNEHMETLTEAWTRYKKGSYDERVRNANKYLDKAITKLEADIKNGKLEYKEKAEGVTSPELVAKRERLKSLYDQRKELRDAAGIENPNAKKRVPKDRLESAKEAIIRRMNDVRTEIMSGEKKQKDSKAPPTDAELKALQEHKQLLDDLHEVVFPKQPMTDAQRITAMNRALDRSITQLEGELQSGQLSTGTKKKAPVTSVGTETRRNRLEELRQQKKDLLSPSDPQIAKDAKSNENYKKGLQKSLDKLLTKIENKDFSKETVKQRVLNKEATDLKSKINDAKLEFKKLEADFQYSQYGPAMKTAIAAKRTIDTARAVMTSFDNSALLRQGGWVAMSHPLIAASTIPHAGKAFFSKSYEFRVAEQIGNRPNSKWYDKTKLAITKSEGALNAQEEAYMGAFRIPGVAGSERAYITTLNLMRADLFDALAANLVKGGLLRKGGDMTPKEAQAITNYVNAATGRGNLGKFNDASKFLTTLFFSPRFLWSRVQLLTGQPMWGGSARTRVLVAKEYARVLISLGIMYGTTAAAASMFKKGQVDIEYDPRSSNFGKIKIGDTKIDILMGLGQVISFGTQSALGEKKETTGEISAIRDKWNWSGRKRGFSDSTWLQVAANFLRSKASPPMGAAVDILSGTDFKGDETTIFPKGLNDPFSGVVARNTLPMPFRDIFDNIKESGVPAGTAYSLLGFLGMNSSTYQDAKPENLAFKISQHSELTGTSKKTNKKFDYRKEVGEVVAEAKKRGVTQSIMTQALEKKLRGQGYKQEAIQAAKTRLMQRYSNAQNK